MRRAKWGQPQRVPWDSAAPSPAIPDLVEALKHKDVRSSIESLKALRKYEDPKSHVLFFSSLKDLLKTRKEKSGSLDGD